MRREHVSDAAEAPAPEDIDLEHKERYGGPELAVEELDGDKVVYNSKFFKKEYNKLKRIAEGPRSVEFPQITKAFTGTSAEQHDVIRRFVESGGNENAVEAEFTAERTHEVEGRGERKLMTVKEMREAGFSEAKINACVQKGGAPNEDCPTDMASMRFWAHTVKTETTRDATQLRSTVRASIAATSAVQALATGFAPAKVGVAVDAANVMAQAGPHPQAQASAQQALPAPATGGGKWLLLLFFVNLFCCIVLCEFVCETCSDGRSPAPEGVCQAQACSWQQGPFGNAVGRENCATENHHGANLACLHCSFCYMLL